MKYLFVANWKMNPNSLREVRALFSVSLRAQKNVAARANIVICPPFPYIVALSHYARASVALGAQDIFYETDGAFTGEISPKMLKSVGVSHVIVGHSERRAMGETDDIVAKKARAAIRGRLVPIVCVGERERDAHGAYFSFLENELRESLKGISRAEAKKIVVAYEPLWAIGAKGAGADTPEGTRETTLFLRKILASLFGHRIAFTIPILYGGAVDKKNAQQFLLYGGVEGLLVGRASINAAEWLALLSTFKYTGKNS